MFCTLLRCRNWSYFSTPSLPRELILIIFSSKVVMCTSSNFSRKLVCFGFTNFLSILFFFVLFFFLLPQICSCNVGVWVDSLMHRGGPYRVMVWAHSQTFWVFIYLFIFFFGCERFRPSHVCFFQWLRSFYFFLFLFGSDPRTPPKLVRRRVW